MDSSQVRLEQLGYRQELKRVLSHASNFSVSSLPPLCSPSPNLPHTTYPCKLTHLLTSWL